ncbi:MAG: hypothetical protein OXC72_06200 [Roseovarius sp.]|nr:hypothetical protein [Roseovarius sp.]
MKPNFALTMSFEGIGLLHRTERGWHLVGNVDLESPHLGSELTVLRSKALALAPNGMSSKLVIPNDQIRYMKFNATELNSDNLADELCRYLEDATPYNTDELVFDWAHDNGEIYVAAVARQTLEEAEAFASEHRFAPLCFVAIPNKEDFAGEPWFGETASANAILQNGTTVERDNAIIKIIGSKKMPKPERLFESDALPTPVETTHPQSSEHFGEPAVSEHYGQSVSTNRNETDGQSDEIISPALKDDSRDSQVFHNEPTASATENTHPTLVVDTAPRLPTPKSETQRMTVFGARKPDKKKKFPYTIDAAFAFFMAMLIIGLIILVFIIKESDFIRLSGSLFDKSGHALAASNYNKLEDFTGIKSELDADNTGAKSILSDGSNKITATAKYSLNSKNEADRHYASTGVWYLPPNSQMMPYSPALGEIYHTDLDTEVIVQNAFVLDGQPTYEVDSYILHKAGGIPAAFDWTKNRGIPGNVISAENANWYKIVRVAANSSKDGLIGNGGSQNLSNRSALHPVDLAEQRYGEGMAENKIATTRPKIRPTSVRNLPGKSVQNPSATEQAVAISRKPKQRPRNFHQIVRKNRIASILPSSEAVQDHATRKNAIKLSKKNVIGIYGTPSKREALIRKSNGKYERLKVGDPFDGGYVAAIGNTEIRYVKDGIFLILKIPTS